MMRKKLFTFLVCVLLLFSLCACVEEESPETIATPPIDSLVEYKISDTEYIRLFYQGDQSIGEWVCEEDTKRIAFEFHIDYWGLLFSRQGITKLTVSIYEVEEMRKTTYLTGENTYIMQTTKELARFDKGLLNTQSITMSDSTEVRPILSITVAESASSCFDWASPEWKAFSHATEKQFFEIEEIALRYDPDSGTGEWKTNGASVPIRIQFDPYVCAIEIYDVSGETEARILAGNGHLESGALIIDHFESKMFYQDSVKKLTVTKHSLPS